MPQTYLSASSVFLSFAAGAVDDRNGVRGEGVRGATDDDRRRRVVSCLIALSDSFGQRGLCRCPGRPLYLAPVFVYSQTKHKRHLPPLLPICCVSNSLLLYAWIDVSLSVSLTLVCPSVCCLHVSVTISLSAYLSAYLLFCLTPSLPPSLPPFPSVFLHLESVLL